MNGRTNKKELYIGIDLNDQGALISFYTPDMVEPETQTTGAESEQFVFPTAVVRTDTGKLFYGEEAVRRRSDPGAEFHDNLLLLALRNENPRDREYLLLFLKRLLAFRRSYLRTDDMPYYLSITLPKIDAQTVELFTWIRKQLELPQHFFKLTDYRESFFDYTILQDRSIWKNDTILFDFSTSSIVLYDMTISGKLHPLDAQVDTKTFSVPENVLQNPGEKDAFFAEIIRSTLENRMISGVYLIGEGFDGDWLDVSIHEFGTNKRIFIGKNLYTRGACLGAYRQKEDLISNIRFVCDYKISAELSICTLVNQRITYLPLVEQGQNWFDSLFESDLLYNGRDSLEIWIRLPETGHTFVTALAMEDFPVREPKSMRLHVKAMPVNDRVLKMIVRDDGFGGIFASTGKRWEFEIPLNPEIPGPETTGHAPDTLFLLCTGAKADEPYLLKPDEMPVQTLEELCYYLKEHLFLLNENTFDKEMITWIRRKIGMPALAGKLENHVVRGSVPYPAVYALFEASGIYGREELLEIRESIRILENQTAIEKRKQRADYLLSHEQNKEALYLYLAILEEHNLYKMPGSLQAEIYYHAGIVYARYFLYRDAMKQFETAYRTDPREPFRKAYYEARQLLLRQDTEAVLPKTDLPVEEEELLQIEKEIRDRYLAIRHKAKTKADPGIQGDEDTEQTALLNGDLGSRMNQAEVWLAEYEKSLR